MNLYWVTTEDHAEDWFVLARNAKEAGTLHEDMEGYVLTIFIILTLTSSAEGKTALKQRPYIF